jgi:2'-5' RNA ligase
MKKNAIAYWLIPAKDKRELFCEIIRIFYKQFNAPNFDPHLTVLVTTNKQSPPKKVLKQITGRPIRLKVRGNGFSSKFTKTLFVRFTSSPALRKFTVDLARAAQVRAKPLKDPHISLLYKKYPASVKADLAKTIRLPFREVVFDSILAVRMTLPVRNRKDVEAWRVIAKKSLRK